MSPLTAIVVLNWNNGAETIACLRSLGTLSTESVAVLVVDNGSTDDSVALIRSHFPAIELLILPSNRGYAGGNNAGFAKVREMGAQFVIFLNNDTRVEHGFVAPLVEALATDPAAGIAVPKIFFLDRPDRIWYAGGTVRLNRGEIRHDGIRKKDGEAFSLRSTTGYATGCCLAMRTADFHQSGGFDEQFGMYCEDVDLSLRVRAAGMTVLFVPASRIWHKVSASLPGGAVRKMIRKSMATVKLLRKHHQEMGIFFYILLLPFRLAGTFFSEKI